MRVIAFLAKLHAVAMAIAVMLVVGCAAQRPVVRAAPVGKVHRVELRKQHARAIFLATRDDDQPRHVTGANVARLDAFDALPLSPDPMILLELPAMLDANACIVDTCAAELPRD